jgi:hypothetical protein
LKNARKISKSEDNLIYTEGNEADDLPMMLLDSVDVNVKTEVQLRKAKKEEIYEDAMMDLYIGLRT